MVNIRSKLDSTINTVFPNFILNDINDNTINNTYFENRITAIIFFDFGCAGCLPEISYINKLKTHYKNKPVNIIGFAFETKNDLLAFNCDTCENQWQYKSKVLGEKYLTVRDYPTIKYQLIPLKVKLNEKERNICPATIRNLVKLTPLIYFIDYHGKIRNHDFQKNKKSYESKLNYWIEQIDFLLREINEE